MGTGNEFIPEEQTPLQKLRHGFSAVIGEVREILGALEELIVGDPARLSDEQLSAINNIMQGITQGGGMFGAHIPEPLQEHYETIKILIQEERARRSGLGEDEGDV